MSRLHDPIDDYVLASFLAGTLPELRRRELVARLAVDRDLRELLIMASDLYRIGREAPVERFHDVAA
jgi:hypothetical protein